MIERFIDKDWAPVDNRVIVKINPNKNLKGVPLDSLYEEYGDEEEILLPRNSKFKILNKIKTNDGWELTIIPV